MAAAAAAVFEREGRGGTYVPKGVCLSVCGMHGERKLVLSHYLLLGAAIKQQFTFSCSACCVVSPRFTHIAVR